MLWAYHDLLPPPYVRLQYSARWFTVLKEREGKLRQQSNLFAQHYRLMHDPLVNDVCHFLRRFLLNEVRFHFSLIDPFI